MAKLRLVYDSDDTDSEHKQLADIRTKNETLGGLRAFHGGSCPDCGSRNFGKMSGWKGNICVMKAGCQDCGFSFRFENPAPAGSYCYETSSIQSNFEVVANERLRDYIKLDHKSRLKLVHETQQKEITSEVKQITDKPILEGEWELADDE